MECARRNVHIANSRVASANTENQDLKLRKNWSDWCDTHNFDDTYTVYEDKICLYVSETLVEPTKMEYYIRELTNKEANRQVRKQ